MGEGKRGGQMVKSSYHIVWGRGTGKDAWSSEMYIYIYGMMFQEEGMDVYI